ncbi:MAG TPA: aldehyde dehydrogenase family protein [Spirochaetia bacterium]|nr:aldehyde dehydrogenase family protein [Spirochaetia bacterium]
MDHGFLIGGQRVYSADSFPVVDPATGEPFARVAKAGPAEVDLAVREAREALEDRRWSMIAPLERGRILNRIGELIRDHGDELAALMCRENGMTLNMALYVEIPLVVDTFSYYGGLVAQVSGETLPFAVSGAPPDYLAMTVKEPVGVTAQITPWNFPLLMPAWKIAPALAAGCPVVLKPSSETPLTALRLAEICLEAGVPEGMLNVITGSGDIVGRALVTHPDVRKIAFTGETATGRSILRDAADGIKRVTLELGGKSPNIVFEDADLEAAVSGALFGIFLNQGQVCQAGSRILVQESVYDAFVALFTERTAALTVGPGTEVMSDLGPVVSQAQLLKVGDYIAAGLAQGAELLTGGGRPALSSPFDKGFFVEPTVFGAVTPDMRIAREEIFGPVAAVMSFASEAELIRLANSTIYGLAGAVWTRDIKRAFRVARAIGSGTVWINTYQLLSPTVPFGGFKQSGLGRELGRQGLESYLETKTIIVDLNETPVSYF